MYQIPYFALAGLLVTFGVPVALMAACGLAQLRLAQTLNPCAFPLPVSTGLALGLALYFLRDRREALAAVYLVFCVYQFSAEALYGVFPVQWMMVLALPLMLRYNGEKGRGWKWFFYFYYPAHTCLLFLLARALG